MPFALIGLLTLLLAGRAPEGAPAEGRLESGIQPTSLQHSGIREEIAEPYRKRYQAWKDEFLATRLGRTQWDQYAQNPRFVLTISISRENNNGAGTGQYVWDAAGRLTAAAITLGAKLDEGFPNPAYYPVMHSLAPVDSSYVVSGSVLAATKIAHEFGHVNRMMVTDSALYKVQFELVPAYNAILFSNGRRTSDPRLIEMARQMGGTPVEIWEDREYWGEANAMLYLRDRITDENQQCALFGRIHRSVQLYAHNFAGRFATIAIAPCNLGSGLYF